MGCCARGQLRNNITPKKMGTRDKILMFCTLKQFFFHCLSAGGGVIRCCCHITCGLQRAWELVVMHLKFTEPALHRASLGKAGWVMLSAK